MKTTITLLGVAALICAGIVMAADDNAPTPTAPANPAPGRPADAKAAPADAPASNPKETPIREHVLALVNAYNVPEIDALTELFTADAVVVDPAGVETRGKQAIGEMYAEEFDKAPGVKLESKVEEVRFLTNDVARVEGGSRLSTGTGDANEFTRFSALLLNRDGKWLVTELRDYPSPVEDVSAYERLKELEWMVGDWVDEGDNNKVTSSIRWAENESFLIRTYSVEIAGEKASSGTMFIGWDPQTGQIKSWVFSSGGGHGEGLWTRTGENQWIVKAQGVQRNGQPNSATQIHTILNKDVVKTSSIDRIIGGQVAPDIADIVMVRKPPQPQTGGDGKSTK